MAEAPQARSDPPRPSRRVVRVFRYDPAEGGPGRFGEFAINIEDETTTTILDLLFRLQREQDPSLAFRYACRVNMCGSCALVVNGRERLACKTNLAELPEGVITLRPLNHLPVVRDLVVDLEPFFERLRTALPFYEAASDSREPARIRPDSPERRDIGLATECIQCASCFSSCTMARLHPDYAGPAALNRAFTLLADSRDALFDERLELVLEGCYRCRTEFNCTEVCPKDLSPTRAIKRIQWFALARPAAKRGRRPARAKAPAPAPGAAPLPAPAAADPGRRLFLKGAVWAIGAACAGALGLPLARAALGPRRGAHQKRVVRLGNLADFPPSAVKSVVIRYPVRDGFHDGEASFPVLVARGANPDDISAFNSACPHLGCAVRWNEKQSLFLCSCHGGVFHRDGRVKSGPPPRGLDRYAVRVEGAGEAATLFAEIEEDG